jgi:hypothetical protein
VITIGWNAHDVYELARRAPLDLNAARALPTQGMPAIMDGDILPDMGRMTARLRSRAKMPCLLATTSAPKAGCAMIASLIETCKLNAVDPLAWMTDVLTKLVNSWPASKIDQLMPWAYSKLA